MRITHLFSCAVLSAALATSVLAQVPASQPPSPSDSKNILNSDPWEIGPLIQGGFGVGERASFHFLSAGVHIGKVLTDPAGPGLLRGQFEYAAEIYPYWQAFTPAPHLQTVHFILNGQPQTAIVPYGGGTFTGASITPIILRWNLRPRYKSSSPERSAQEKLVPYLQGAGGLIWTNHKFPPDAIVPHGTPGGTSVFNFTPQFGIGFNYFVKPRRSITFSANAIHISSASLGDRNPGVNASVQFQLGYNWWK